LYIKIEIEFMISSKENYSFNYHRAGDRGELKMAGKFEITNKIRKICFFAHKMKQQQFAQKVGALRQTNAANEAGKILPLRSLLSVTQTPLA
jgi:DNA-binding XRE family transcriptional regulator